MVLPIAAVAQQYNWQGPTTDDLWTTVGNWNNAIPGLGNVAVFSSSLTAGQTVDLGPSNVTVAGVTFNGKVSPGNTLAAITNPGGPIDPQRRIAHSQRDGRFQHHDAPLGSCGRHDHNQRRGRLLFDVERHCSPLRGPAVRPPCCTRPGRVS